MTSKGPRGRKPGVSMGGVERSPQRRRRDDRRSRQQEAWWAAKSGPVTIRQLLPEDPAAVAPGQQAADARKKRALAALKWRPEHVRTLLVAQAPPGAKCGEPERYFYYEDVYQHDHLFRGVVRAVFERYPERSEKRGFLRELHQRGFFLIDLKLDPIDAPPPLHECVSDAICRAKACAPDRVLLIKTDVFDLAFVAMREAGLPVVAERIPFPSSGRQNEFHAACQRALRS